MFGERKYPSGVQGWGPGGVWGLNASRSTITSNCVAEHSVTYMSSLFCKAKY